MSLYLAKRVNSFSNWFMKLIVVFCTYEFVRFLMKI